MKFAEESKRCGGAVAATAASMFRRPIVMGVFLVLQAENGVLASNSLRGSEALQK
jgi:hypothetical protein